MKGGLKKEDSDIEIQLTSVPFEELSLEKETWENVLKHYESEGVDIFWEYYRAYKNRPYATEADKSIFVYASERGIQKQFEEREDKKLYFILPFVIKDE